MPMFVANTGALDLVGLKSHTEDVFLNEAEVTFTVIDHGGDEVIGQTWPQVMEYVEGSDGNYRGILPASLELVAKQKYKAVIDAAGGGERFGHWEVPFKPVVRTGLPEGETLA